MCRKGVEFLDQCIVNQLFHDSLEKKRNIVITSHQVLHRPEETECHLQCSVLFEVSHEI